MFVTFKTRTNSLSNFVKTLSRDRRKAEFWLSGVLKCSSDDASIAAKEFNFGAGYTDEEKNLILEKVNACTIDEFKRYGMTEARVKKLIAHREKIQSFTTFDQLFLSQGIEIGVLNKFCKSIVTNKIGQNMRSLASKGSGLLTPPLDEHTRIIIDTCTGIWICGNLISWARLDTNCNLLQWDCQSLGDIAIKDGLVVVVDSVARVLSKVPPSHAYVMESDPIVPFSRMNSAAYYLHLQRQQIIATVASILGTREHRVDGNEESDNPINNVYMMRHRSPARLFDLIVGSEIVSARGAVEKMIEKSHVDGRTISIETHPDIKKSYKSRDLYQREQMNWALLLTLAFVNLSIMRTPFPNKKSVVKNTENNKS